MRLVVGLGNPGPKYERNRHNIGFLAVDEIVCRHSFGPWRSQFQGVTCQGEIGGEKLLFLKPATFMNESGCSVGEAARFFKLDPGNVIVLYDELDLSATRLKVKQGGGNGGHNGLKSIDAHLGKDYWRVRIGIGHPGDKSKVIGHVLSDFSKSEWPDFARLIEVMSGRFDLLATDKVSDFMSKIALDLGPVPPPRKGILDPASKHSAVQHETPGTALGSQLKRWISGSRETG